LQPECTSALNFPVLGQQLHLRCWETSKSEPQKATHGLY
jgi:hypothetical protein